MAGKGYYRWSRDITRQLNNMLEKDKRAIQRIMDVEAEKTYIHIVDTTPVDTGELQRNIFLDHYETDNGYGVGVGISTTQHIPDNFSNTKLAGWLINKPNVKRMYPKNKPQSKSQAQMRSIANALYDLKYNVKQSIDAYWKSKQNNGGK